ncbi:MAG: glycosyltransferase family 9 protein, partial [bacterium]|nr:glycosyltransferase family 9 protein [bacterium]
MNKKKKILFINFGGLGDEILFLPTILSIKAQYPQTEITLALEPRSKGITSLTDVIDKTLFADIKGRNKYNELIKLLFKIWGEGFDLVVSSGSNKYISIFLACTLIPKRIGYNTGKLSEKLLTRAVNLNKNQYAVDMYHDLAKPLTDIVTELPVFSIQKKPQIPNSVLIHPGVSKISAQKGMIKTIPATEWAKVVELLADSGKNVILAGGPDDVECIKTIQKLVPQGKYTNMYGKTANLKELAELISSAEIFLCSDSAPLHIAVGMGVKTYAIFGSTDDKKLIPQNGLVTPIKSDCY